jgi:histidine triad (HIT) family protein
MFFNSEDLEGEFLRGSGAIIPKAHRPTVFELTPDEIVATFELLRQARPLLDERYKPDGFNIGWNCYAAGGGGPHAHLHLLLRFWDEPKAGQGIRWPLRQPDNRRPRSGCSGTRRQGFSRGNCLTRESFLTKSLRGAPEVFMGRRDLL